MRKTLNAAIDDQIEKLEKNNDTLEAMVGALKEHVAELKGELTIFKGMEQCFHAMGIKDDSTKSPLASLGRRMISSSLPSLKRDNGGGDHEEEGQVKNCNGGNGKNGDNGKPHNGKWKANNKMKGLVKYFLCDGLHIMRDCPKKSALFVEVNDEPDKETMRLGSIMHSLEAKRVRENGRRQ
ncbi:hypothetical protein Golob_024962 [Gossypium lobatum]|uniref:Uncharacterized protein n=1 Tax=Gossypium lobatum TaxID=34289 RepID=A0A7J8NKG4_9ROSI|nr:hypothetical protein [Gossypium lobatum]